MVFHEKVATKTVSKDGLLAQNNEKRTRKAQGQRQSTLYTNSNGEYEEQKDKDDGPPVLASHVGLVESRLNKDTGDNALEDTVGKNNVLASSRTIGFEVEKASSSKEEPGKQEGNG